MLLLNAPPVLQHKAEKLLEVWGPVLQPQLVLVLPELLTSAPWMPAYACSAIWQQQVVSLKLACPSF